MRTFLFFLIIVSAGSAFNFGNRYFEILLDHFEVVFETPNVTECSLKVKKINKTRVLAGTVTTYVEWGNDMSVEFKVLKKQGGEYRYLPYRIPATPTCDGLRNEKYVYPDFARASDFPLDIENNCPFAIGTYNVYNVTSDLSNIPSIERIAQSGDYCGEAYHYWKGQHIATHRLYVSINNV